MNKVTGIVTKYTGQGTKVIIEKEIAKTFSLTLVKDMVWDIGIDQSSSCTGLCFQSVDKKFQILLDFYRDRALPNTVFYAELTRFMERTLRGMNVRMLICEKPAPVSMYASRVLEELKGHIDAWKYTIPELENALMDSVFQQTWKSYVVDKRKGKGRHNKKYEVACDVVDKFPLLKPYLEQYPWSDYDSFDATGILNGFLDYAFTKDGNEKIHGVKEKTHTSLVGYYWTNRNDTNILMDLFGELGIIKALRLKWLVYNDGATLHDNIRMASSNYDFICTALPSNVLGQFEWKYDINADDASKIMFMFVIRQGHYKNSDIAFFKQQLPWNEEVYNE